MYVFKTNRDFDEFRGRFRASGAQVGFVPTMGALHEGHLSLIRQSLGQNDLTVCSIFVNPTQFNQARDLEKYPRIPEKDIILLEKAGCQVLYMPAVGEIYPDGLDTAVTIDLQGLDERMEGRFRPGHFKGVMQVVKRLLDIVQPDRLYMGQKDFQQLCIVARMIGALRLPVTLIMGETLREPDGLAMSSRNLRLTAEWRAKAPLIHQVLQETARDVASLPASDLQKRALDKLAGAGFEPEYLEIADRTTLSPVDRPGPGEKAVICAAAWAGEVRLIDNVLAEA